MPEDFSIVETAPTKVQNPYVLVGIPDIGLVGSIATSHLIQALGMSEVGHLESEILPPVMIIRNSEPKPPIRIFSKNKILIVAADVAVPSKAISPMAKKLTEWSKSIGAELIVGVSGLAVPNRVEIEKPAVYGIGTTDETRERLKKLGVPVFEQGVVVGAYALLLKEAIKQGQPNVTLLAEAHYQFPDPGASASLLEILGKLLDVKVEVKSLLEQAEEIRIKTRGLWLVERNLSSM